MRFARVLAGLFLSLLAGFANPAFALNTWGTDMSDLWWNPNESGWGANIVHQKDVIFMTIFAYGPDSQVKWYVASAMRAQSTGIGTAFTGTLYQTSGPYFGGTFDPSAVTVRPVGSATLILGTTTGTLSYTVDGVPVTKSIQRQTFAQNDLSGSYVGALVGQLAGCGTSSGSFQGNLSYVVTQSGSSISIVATGSNGASCTYAGTYSQSGRMGAVNGTASCTDGSRGAFQAQEVEAGTTGFLGRYTVDYGGGCTEAGRMGGLKQ